MAECFNPHPPGSRILRYGHSPGWMVAGLVYYNSRPWYLLYNEHGDCVVETRVTPLHCLDPEYHHA